MAVKPHPLTPRPCRSGRHMFTGKQCMECLGEKSLQWRRDNPERKREYARRDYVKNVIGNPVRKAKVDVDNLAWAKANRKRQREISTRWRAANPEKAKEQGRRWRKANPEKNCAKTQRRKTRIAGGVVDLTDAQWQAILDFHSSPEGTRCAYCFGVCEKVSVDHVVPIFKGGGHTSSNVVPSCLPCNWSKNVKEVASWAG